MLERAIPKSNELLPVIGLGTWQTFDVGEGDHERRPLIEVLRRFAAAGGKAIDSSPMYGRAELVVGDLRSHVPGAFLATKVWTRGRQAGIDQMKHSFDLFGTKRIDLMQIHNLVDWKTHLATLRAWKESGRIRYIGITHYQTGAFPQLAEIMSSEDIDFVQLPYSITVPDAEERLLPLAQDKGIAVLVNRPFEEGHVFRNARARGITAEIALRWIVSHPAVTCVIPATANPQHMDENLRAGDGELMSMKERADLRRKAGR
jgi:diketogulonate reductase-like aldo/keto reductase